jgi:hypothetical protein
VLSTSRPQQTAAAASKKRKADDESSRAILPRNIPADFECPILMDLMTDPVICSDGFSYERAAIEDWLQRHNTSPKTNENLPNKNLIPNKTLRAAIITWKDSNR